MLLLKFRIRLIGEAMIDDAASVVSLDVDLDIDEKDFEQDDEGWRTFLKMTTQRGKSCQK